MKYKKIVIILVIIIILEILTLGGKQIVDYLSNARLPKTLQVESATIANANLMLDAFSFFSNDYMTGSMSIDEYTQVKSYSNEELKIDKEKGIDILLGKTSLLFLFGKNRELHYSIYNKNGNMIVKNKIKNIGKTVNIDIKDLNEDIYYLDIFYYCNKGSASYAIKLVL